MEDTVIGSGVHKEIAGHDGSVEVDVTADDSPVGDTNVSGHGAAGDDEIVADPGGRVHNEITGDVCP